MLLNPIIEHLRECLPTWSNRIAGAAEFAAVEDKARLTIPAMYVMLGASQMSLELSISPTIQIQMDERFIIYVCLEQTERRGQSAQEQIDGIKKALFGCLFNYVCDRKAYAIVYVSDRMVAMDRARYFHQFEFKQVSQVDESDGWAEVLANFDKFYADVELVKSSEEVHPDMQIQIEDIYNG